MGTAALSLRHLAIILERPSNWNDLGYRVLDLRSTTGFEDGTGRVLRGLRCEGPSYIRCDNFALFFFRTSDTAHWPRSGKDAWAMLPESVYLEEMTRFAEGSKRYVGPISPPKPVPAVRSQTLITRTVGPVSLVRNLVHPEEEIVGTLVVSGPASELAFEVGSLALSQGILVGRYEDRCSASQLMDESVSRVHLLIVKNGNSVYAIDTGSSNGTYVGDEEIRRVAKLSPRGFVTIGMRGTHVRWKGAS
jgi:pSer/pThr/pTyr-binding forkhead associated (FHA) protein